MFHVFLSLITKVSPCASRDNASFFVDKISEAREKRPGLEACLSTLGEGDVLIVWKLDRLGRSLKHLVDLVTGLFQKKIGFKSLCNGHIGTTTASGELMFNIFSPLAQLERRLIQERTRAGLEAARARGKKGGRKPLNPFDQIVLAAQMMHQDHSIGVEEICQALNNISLPTLYRYLKVK